MEARMKGNGAHSGKEASKMNEYDDDLINMFLSCSPGEELGIYLNRNEKQTDKEEEHKNIMNICEVM